MTEKVIYNCRIEHDGDVNKGLHYLKDHWDDRYILDVFENAKTSTDRSGDFRIPNVEGTYVLRSIGEHHYSLHWKNY